MKAKKQARYFDTDTGPPKRKFNSVKKRHEQDNNSFNKKKKKFKTPLRNNQESNEDNPSATTETSIQFKRKKKPFRNNQDINEENTSATTTETSKQFKRKKKNFKNNQVTNEENTSGTTTEISKQFKPKKKHFHGNNFSNNVGQTDSQNPGVQVFKININAKVKKQQLLKDKKLDKLKSKSAIVKKKHERYPGKAPIDPKKLERYSRGQGIGKGVRHPIYAEKLRKKENKFKYAQEQSARAEILLTEDQGGLDVGEDVKTTAVSQKIIKEHVDIAAASKIFELDLDFGPYRAKYSRNGRHLLIGSRKGHLAAFDWVTKKLHCEINVMESIHDISWLHVETMMAVAQKEWLYIYDNTGTEIHCIKRMDKILRMEFLPYHFLLAAVNEFGFITWLDISIGDIVGQYNNKQGRSTVMAQNPYNATICLGNSKGVVSLWSPTVKEPLAKILCHKTPLTAIAVDSRGMYMATAGNERSLKIWDIRNLDGPLQDYRLRTAPVDLDFSQKDMLAVGLGSVVEVYNDCCIKTVERPYMRHRMAKDISNFKFCPYEDVLGIGTSKGFTSIIIPGSGEPNFDALESNPFQNKRQRKEAEVKALLDKIPAELITLNPYEVTEVDVPSVKEQMEAKKKLLHVKPKKVDLTPRHKKKGKTNIARKKIIKAVARKELIQQSIEAQKLVDKPEEPKKPKQSFGVLDRFVSKK